MNLFAQLREYLRSSQKELEAVRWPTRQETIRYSVLVIGVSVVFAAFFGLLDLGLNSLVQVYVERQPINTSANQQPITEDITPTTTSPIEVEATTPSGATTTIKAVQVPLDSSSTK